MFVEFLIKKFFQSCSARTGFTRMHDVFIALRVVNNLLDQVFVCQVPVHYINQQHNILMSATNANRVSHFWVSQNTPFGSQGTELWEPNIYIRIFFFESGIWFLQVSKSLFMYSFTNTNIAFLFRHLPTETVSFIIVCYQLKCLSGESFSFFGAGFANIPPTFFI